MTEDGLASKSRTVRQRLTKIVVSWVTYQKILILMLNLHPSQEKLSDFASVDHSQDQQVVLLALEVMVSSDHHKFGTGC